MVMQQELAPTLRDAFLSPSDRPQQYFHIPQLVVKRFNLIMVELLNTEAPHVTSDVR